jgi:hypothetical protein
VALFARHGAGDVEDNSQGKEAGTVLPYPAAEGH